MLGREGVGSSKRLPALSPCTVLSQEHGRCSALLERTKASKISGDRESDLGLHLALQRSQVASSFCSAEKQTYEFTRQGCSAGERE